jgi:hypothetical protein
MRLKIAFAFVPIGMLPAHEIAGISFFGEQS